MTGPGRRHYLTGSPLDRRADLRQASDAAQLILQSGEHVVVPVSDGQVLVQGDDPVTAVLIEGARARALLDEAAEAILLGQVQDRHHWAIPMDATSAEALADERHAQFASLRSVSVLVDRPSAAILAHAKAITHFHAHHAYCGRCGSPTRSGGLGSWRVCRAEECGHTVFPRSDPAIITRLARGSECLLVRQPEWRPRQYATVAGFVEPGESLEEAVVREVREEVGLEVLAVSYHSSQPWPFPSGVMIGFDVQVRGEVILEDPEIENARWFSREDMRRARDSGEILLPSTFSISRRLIDDWLEEEGAGPGG